MTLRDSTSIPAIMGAMNEPSPLARRATIDFWQLPSGYWRASVVVRVPHLPTFDATTDMLHSATECMEWARLTIENYISALSQPWPT